MNALSERRLAENEVIFRQLNTEVKNFVLQDAKNTAYATQPLRFYCECSNADCRERVAITAQEYDIASVGRKQFIVKNGHVMPEIEAVVKKTNRYSIVEKNEVPPAPEDIDPKLFF